MNNELLLILSLVLIYTCVVLFYRFLGRSGLYCWTVLATIAANIEVLIVVDAFGMEQTLGNILFASTFLVTDILSETEGKRAANKAVLIGIRHIHPDLSVLAALHAKRQRLGFACDRVRLFQHAAADAQQHCRLCHRAGVRRLCIPRNLGAHDKTVQ